MSVRTCCHPNCDKQMKHGQSACGRHWYQLSEDLRQRLSSKSGGQGSAVGALLVEARDYLERERLIGKHEILDCRGEDCDSGLVWLKTRKGKVIPVNAESVDASDELYDHKKHAPHWASCPNADDFRL